MKITESELATVLVTPGLHQMSFTLVLPKLKLTLVVITIFTNLFTVAGKLVVDKVAVVYIALIGGINTRTVE